MGSRTWRTMACLVVSLVSIAALAPSVSADTDTTPPAPFDIVADVGEFQTGYSVVSPWNSIYVTWQSTTDDIGPFEYELSVDGVVQRVVPPEPSAVITKRVEVPEGIHEVAVTAVDAAGNRRSANQSLEVLIDKVEPYFVEVPALQMVRGPVSADHVPLRFTWSAADADSGLSYSRVGYGASCCVLLPAETTRYDFSVPLRSDQRWRVAIYDFVARTTRKITSTFVHAAPRSDVRYVGAWAQRTISGGFDGTEFLSDTSGDRAVLRSRDMSVAWVAAQGPKRGVAVVLVDGERVATIDLHAPTPVASHIVWSTALAPGQAHRIEIVNRSSRQRPFVGIEALLVHERA